MRALEGHMLRDGNKTWYLIHGQEGNGIPLLVLHGGPGFPHNALNNTSALAENGYPVVLYDQLGCGKSDRPNDTSLWTVKTFVEELEALRQHLGFKKINVLGQSWGGSLAIEYALAYPKNVSKLVLHSPLIDSQLWVREAEKLKDKLPGSQGKRMRELEQAGKTDCDEYHELSDLFDETFVMRVKPKPQDYLDTIAGGGLPVYHTMWGPSEAYCNGNLKNWSVIDELKHISCNTLLISGKYDEATPKQMQIIADNVPNIEWKLFDKSSHCANLEEPEKYLKLVADFLST